MGASASNEIVTPYQGSGITGVFPHSKGSTTTLPPHLYPRSHEDGNFNPAVAISLDKAPTALIVGAGMAGVHVAYELAARGFKVNVIDSNAQVGLGSTAFSNPIIGDHFRPFVFERFSLRSAVVSALFGTRSPGGLFLEDTSALFLANLKCFNAVRRSLTCESGHLEAMFNNISEETAAIVKDLSNRYPALQGCVVRIPSSPSPGVLMEPLPINTTTATAPNASTKKPKKVNTQPPIDPAMKSWSLSPRNNSSLEEGVEGVVAKEGEDATTSKDRLLMNPLKWTRTLAHICQEELGVEFHMNTDLFSISTKEHSDGTDVVSQVVVDIKQVGPKKKVLVGRKVLTADVYVLAAGTGLVPALNHLIGEVPLIPIDGLAVIMPRPKKSSEAPQEQSALERLLSTGGWSSQNGNPLTLAAGYISNNGATFVTPFDRHTFAGRSGGSIDEIAVCGSSTVTTTMRSSVLEAETTISRALKTLYRGCLPTEWRNDIADMAGSAGNSKNRANGIQVLHYPRVVTPDGLPLISRVGPIFNTFAIGGFHDNSCSLAPSCAKALAEMVVHPTQESVVSPLSLARYTPNNIRLRPRDPEPSPEEIINESRRTRAHLGVYEHIGNMINHWISTPVTKAFDFTVLTMFQSDIFGSAFKDWLYINYITLEHEELIRGGPIEEHRSFPQIQITSNTINSTSATNPLYPFKEGHRVLSAGREIVEIPLSEEKKKRKSRPTPTAA